MDGLGKYLISDEDEPQPKSRKLKSSSSKINPIKKSNFSQVKINIYEKNYKNWIQEKNSKIHEFFQKVPNQILIFINFNIFFFLGQS